MDNKSFSLQLEQRTKSFALDVIRIAAGLPWSPEGKVLRGQIVRSATSIGANYREAERAVSKADFSHKISLCEKEAVETQYWLELLAEGDFAPKEALEPCRKECSELVAIFTSISKKLKGVNKVRREKL